MWESWFLASGACFGLAAYFLKKRSAYKYPKNEVVYATKVDNGYHGRRVVLPTDAKGAINTEYSISPTSPRATAPEPSFFSEMSAAAHTNEEKTPPKGAETPTNPEETAEEPKFRNIRFFDSN